MRRAVSCLPYVLALVLGAVLALVPGVVPFAASTAEALSSYDKIYLDAVIDTPSANEQLRLMNAERAKVGAPALKMSSVLQGIANQRAAECAVYYSHTRSNGESCFSLFPAASRTVGENIAAGTVMDAAEVTESWMESSGHRANMLNSAYKYVGVACVEVGGWDFWVQCFADTVTGSTSSGGSAYEQTFKVEISRSIVPASNMGLNLGETYSNPETLFPGETYQLEMHVRNTGTSYPIKIPTSASGYTWTSTNPSVVSVDKNGLVTAKSSSGGTATITATSPSGYTWNRTFKVKTSIEQATIAKIPNQVYTGNPIKPTLNITYQGRKLVEGTDYTVSYPSSKEAYTKVGEVTLTVRGNGDWSDYVYVTYKIVPLDISHATFSKIEDQTYTGSAIRPHFTLALNGKSLTSKEYTTTYSNNVNPGTATVTVTGKGNYSGTVKTTFTIKNASTGENQSKPDDDKPSGETQKPAQQGSVTMWRLYNRWTGEHFYTSSTTERNNLTSVGWTLEGVGWKAPTTGERVYRLYNHFVKGGDHHYTMDEEEYDALWRLGWRQEGLAWRSADKSTGVPVYRQYNPYAETGTHNYTLSKEENDALVKVGWKEEGIAWYGVR